MQVEFPKLADTLVDGVVSAWYKRPGDAVRKGEPLFAVETDKVNTDVESPCDGVLAEILVAEGETAEVGQILARFAGEEGVHTAAGRAAARERRPDGDAKADRRANDRGARDDRARIVREARRSEWRRTAR